MSKGLEEVDLDFLSNTSINTTTGVRYFAHKKRYCKECWFLKPEAEFEDEGYETCKECLE